MAPHWCWICAKNKKEWSEDKQLTEEEKWTIENMTAHHGKGLTGADWLGMAGQYARWDCVQPFNYLFPVLHVQIMD